MLGQSGVLTLLGMGIVFGFLVIMVICVSIMGKIVNALGANKVPDEPVPGASVSASTKTTAVAAAITAAITEYQKDNY
jgi:oxaloacetate decarboxylase gamma subunit